MVGLWTHLLHQRGRQPYLDLKCSRNNADKSRGIPSVTNLDFIKYPDHQRQKNPVGVADWKVVARPDLYARNNKIFLKSGMFLDCLEVFRIVWKIFRIVLKVSGQSGLELWRLIILTCVVKHRGRKSPWTSKKFNTRFF